MMNNDGNRRICEFCKYECLAILYCEHCLRNYLKSRFSNWTSGNDNIDNLIKKCQLESLEPEKIIEWIPFNNLQNIKYLPKNGYPEIYTAVWIGGSYNEWSSKSHRLKRFGKQDVILKGLKNDDIESEGWFEEIKSHLTNNQSPDIIPCYGLTQNPLNGSYMLVMNIMDASLREYLQKNNSQLMWKERIQIASDIVVALKSIHDENKVHRNLHSGNIFFKQANQRFGIGDLGFCGPVIDQPLKSIYGNLPYIAPEVIAGKEYTFASEIYSVAILLWEIASGQIPFIDLEHDHQLATLIVKGIRPRMVPAIPLEYKNLMKQCWDSDPSKRPDINKLADRIRDINKLYQNTSNRSEIGENLETNKTNGFETDYASKLYQFEKFPQPRNATDAEQKAFDNRSAQKNLPNKKKGGIFKVTKIFKRRPSQNDINEKETTKHQMYYINDKYKIDNNPKLHLKIQEESTILDVKEFLYNGTLNVVDLKT
ncbi:kinase-like domain-containing protein [Rhizophagus irregularis DAOM 181602=DAOM 197198]|nr:kinase-like domain-containing protein [Rhizophagus irregularis DAOM 181602=DAOM 197198]